MHALQYALLAAGGKPEQFYNVTQLVGEFHIAHSNVADALHMHAFNVER